MGTLERPMEILWWGGLFRITPAIPPLATRQWNATDFLPCASRSRNTETRVSCKPFRWPLGVRCAFPCGRKRRIFREAIRWEASFWARMVNRLPICSGTLHPTKIGANTPWFLIPFRIGRSTSIWEFGEAVEENYGLTVRG